MVPKRRLNLMDRGKQSAMFITGEKSNYDTIFHDLLRWFHEYRDHQPLCSEFFNDPVAVRSDGVYSGEQQLDSIGGILVLRYLIVGGNTPLTGEWVPYRSLPDGAVFSRFIKTQIEDVVALSFSERREKLSDAIGRLGGSPYQSDSNPDVSYVLRPFPLIPVLCLFWDHDEEFPASFQFFFDSSAPDYLDLESLAVLLHYTSLRLMEAGQLAQRVATGAGV
jgi:hypothetical protein